jgi:hypothetical protein
MYSATGSLLVIFFSISLMAESQQKVPRNYVGIAGIYEAGNIGLIAGLEYERWLIVKRNWVLAVKGLYIVPHDTYNFIWPAGNRVKSNSQAQLFATAYFYTTKKNDHTGFLLGLGGGVDHIRSLTIFQDINGEPYDETVGQTLPGFELFTGVQWNFARRFGARLTFGLSHFISGKQERFTESLPVILFFTKASFGF